MKTDRAATLDPTSWALRLQLATLATSLAFVFAASPAFAQFEDEFDEEFAEPQPEPTPEPASEPESFDDSGEFDDAFAEPTAAAAAEDDSPYTEDEPDADVSETSEDDDAAQERERRLRSTFNSWYGPTGGLHVVDAGGGPVGSFRVQLATDFFFAGSFINEGDDADHFGGSLSVTGAVWDYLEIWMSVQSYANANDTEDPTLFQVLGDAQIGIKGFYPVLPFFTIGGDVTLAMLNTVGDIGVVLDSTSAGIRANATLDLREMERPIPFVARFNFQYYFDNSEALVADVEAARYANLSDPEAYEDEYHQLLSPVERFALSINRTDFFNIAVGLEAPIEIVDNFFLSPIVEWNWGIPVNRQGFNCLIAYADDDTDGCLTNEGIAAFPMDLTIALRVAPPVRGLNFILGADIGLTGVSRDTFVRELAANAPYDLYFGLAYNYDVTPSTGEPVIREVERRVEVPIEPPLMGRVHGLVVEQGTETPVPGAVVRFADRDATALVAGDDGRFTTYRFEPGQVTMDITHPEYNAGRCVATIPSERGAAVAAEEPTVADESGSDEFGEEASGDFGDDEFGGGDDFGGFDDGFSEPAAPEPEPAAAAPVAPETGDIEIEVRCELVSLPRVGGINGSVTSAEGGPVVGAQVQLSGPQSRTTTTGPDGRFAAADLPPGTYEVRVDADAFLIKTDSVEVSARDTVEPTIALVPRPRRALVRVNRRSISIRRQINFVTNSAEIESSSQALMTEIADVLIRNPQIQTVEIQGHTDNTGPRVRNLELSQQRADAVRTWLVEHGVEAGRLTARGYGPDSPRVPNITPANRARNRRVEFQITTQE